MQILQIYKTFNNSQNNEVVFQAKWNRSIKKLDILNKDLVEIAKTPNAKKMEFLIREKNVFEKILEGYNQTEIAKMLNIDITRVNEIVKKYDVFQKKLKERNANIIKKLLKGVPRKVIAEEYGLSKKYIDKIATDNKSFRNYLSIRNEKILRMLQDGRTPKEIAKELNISTTTVRRLGYKYNIPPRDIK